MKPSIYCYKCNSKNIHKLFKEPFDLHTPVRFCICLDCGYTWEEIYEVRLVQIKRKEIEYEDKSCNSCGCFHKMLNKDNIRKFGEYYCQNKEEMIKNTDGCPEWRPKEEN